MTDLPGLTRLLEPEFAIGPTSFRINKLLAEEAFDVLERIRAAAGVKIASVETSGSSPVVQVAGALLAIDPAEMKRIRNALWQEVVFQNAHHKTWTKLASNVDSAFDGMEAFNG